MSKDAHGIAVDYAEVEQHPPVRCASCGRVLLRGELPEKALYVRCRERRCGVWNKVCGEGVEARAA